MACKIHHQEDFVLDDAHRRLGRASPGSYSADGPLDGFGPFRTTAPRRPELHTTRGGPRVRPPSRSGSSYRHACRRRATPNYPRNDAPYEPPIKGDLRPRT